jgi:hypothetical protein
MATGWDVGCLRGAAGSALRAVKASGPALAVMAPKKALRTLPSQRLLSASAAQTTGNNSANRYIKTESVVSPFKSSTGARVWSGKSG